MVHKERGSAQPEIFGQKIPRDRNPKSLGQNITVSGRFQSNAAFKSQNRSLKPNQFDTFEPLEKLRRTILRHLRRFLPAYTQGNAFRFSKLKDLGLTQFKSSSVTGNQRPFGTVAHRADPQPQNAQSPGPLHLFPFQTRPAIESAAIAFA